MTTAMLPTEFCNAPATALFVCPETLFGGQLARIVPAPKVPDKAMIVPPYDTSGRLLVRKMVYPTRDIVEPKRMNTALSFVFSA